MTTYFTSDWHIGWAMKNKIRIIYLENWLSYFFGQDNYYVTKIIKGSKNIDKYATEDHKIFCEYVVIEPRIRYSKKSIVFMVKPVFPELYGYKSRAITVAFMPY